MRRIGTILFLSAAFTVSAAAGDWPQYRADADRSGYTSDDLSLPLHLAWVRETNQPPDSAWRAEDRMVFDRAFHPIVAEGKLFYGSSADCQIHALEAATGKELWSFYTDGPVRFSPVYRQGKILAGSDDGYVYCLNANDGVLVWKRRAGPDDDWILGNDRMVSRWPVRGGPVLRDNVLYFGAGIWPSEGFYLYALDPDDGEPLWINSDSGEMEMDQPHGGARAKSGVVAQGHLVATENSILTPTGRAVPASFDRADGAFRYFHLQKNRRYGGSPLVSLGKVYFNNGVIFDASSGELLKDLQTSVACASPKFFYYVSGNRVVGVSREELITTQTVKDRKGEETTQTTLSEPTWEMEVEGAPIISLICAGNSLVAGREDGTVQVLSLGEKNVAWTEQVEGRPLALAVADGALYVGSDDGSIYSFSANQSSHTTVDADPASGTYGTYGTDATYRTAAQEILERTGVREGYCLDLSCGEGELAYEIAKQSNLVVFALDEDPEKVSRARERLDAAGLYGTRVTVAQGDPASTWYPNYFADLVVSGRSLIEGADSVPTAEAERLTRPYGGIRCFGPPGNFQIAVRGPMEGAGNWTHQYADPANTICSGDLMTGGKLGMLWFRDADQEMPQRHGRGPAPLFYEGRLLVEGMHGLRAVDAYNGRTLWEYEIPDILTTYDQDHLVGAAVTGSNFCVADGFVYARTRYRCLKIDVSTGEKVSEFDAPYGPDPGKGRTWGFIACVDGLLYGSTADTSHIVQKAFRDSDMSDQFSESHSFFAMEPTSGKVVWNFKPTHSIRNNTIAIGNGTVFLIDRPKARQDHFAAGTEARRGKESENPEPTPVHEPGTLYALDAKTGEVRWKSEEDIFGTLLAMSEDHDVLVMSYQFTRFKQNSEIGDRLAAFRASDGSRLWDVGVERPEGYRSSSRPVLNGQTVYLEPGAYDLLTGEKTEFSMNRSYGCGIVTSSKNLMLFRSATLGYLNIADAECGTENYGGLRPGCWINAIPAGGLVLMPDASAGCTCSYLNRASIALQPFEVR